MSALPPKMGSIGFDATQHPRRANVSIIPRWKPETIHEDAFFILPLCKTSLLFSDTQHSVYTFHHFAAH